MTIKQAMFAGALGAFAACVLGLTAAGAVDFTKLPPAAQATIQDALTRGDYGVLSRLAPAEREVPPDIDKSNESLEGCGFYAQETRLECVILIKQTGERGRGYGGQLNSFGSQENVLFCVNMVPLDSGINFPIWMPLGRGTTIVHNRNNPGQNTLVQPPWHVAVYRDINPPAGPRVRAWNGALSTTQALGFTYQVKAILWWQLDWYDPQISCNYTPQWGGDILYFNVPVDPIR